MIGVSYVTAPPRTTQTGGPDIRDGDAPTRRRRRARSWNQWDVINSGVVLALILAAYVYFSG